MYYDETRLYTVVNADKVKIGSKGYFADTLAALKQKITDNLPLEELTQVFSEASSARFLSSKKILSFFLFYLVEKPKEKTYRPYKDTAEIPSGAMLDIVIASDSTRLLITAVEDKRVYLGPRGWVDMPDLYNYYLWSNGTPCGKEEQENDE